MELGIMKPTFGLGPDACSEPNVNRVIGINITFSCAGLEPIQRSFFRSEWNSVHLGREPAEISGVANAFMRSDVVPPVMSRKHAEIILVGDTPQVMDIGSYHGTYFRSNGQRLVVNQPYQLADGLVLEFGKSVTKDDKAHEPLLATIKFIRESDRGRFRIASRHAFVTCTSHSSTDSEISLLPPSSPPRRYSIPSDSEDDEDESDEDEMDSRSDVFEYNPHQHIDLTGLSDDSKSSQDEDTDEGIECVGFGFSRGAYDEESISGSDMSESEFEEETGKVIAPMSHPDLFASMGPSPPVGVTAPAPAPIPANPSVHGLITPPVELVAPAPISLPRLPRIETLSCLEYSEVGFYNHLPLPDFARHHIEVASRAPGLDFGYGGMEEVRSGPHIGSQPGGNQVGREHEESQSQAHLEPEPSHVIQESTVQTSHATQVSEQVCTLKAELAVAQNEIAELKRSLVEKEATVVVAAEPPVLELVAEDVPARIANIETMMTQLATVGDGEMCEHRTAVLDMLTQLSSGIEALRIRVGYEAPKSPHQGQKRKRTDEDDEEVESRRAQSPAPMITPTPTAAPSPTKRSRLAINPAVSALVTGAAVWGALASGYL